MPPVNALTPLLLAVAQDTPGAITNSWDSVVDLISNKGDTTEIWQAVQEADLADALDGEVQALLPLHASAPHPLPNLICSPTSTSCFCFA